MHSVVIGIPGASSSFGVFLETTPGSISFVDLDGDNIFDYEYGVWFSMGGGTETAFSRQNNTMHVSTSATNGSFTPEPAY